MLAIDNLKKHFGFVKAVDNVNLEIKEGEIVFAAIELLATSAAEPHIIGRRWRRESPRFVGLGTDGWKARLRAETNQMAAKGIPLASIYNLFDERYGDPGSEEHVEDVVVQDGRVLIEVPDGPLEINEYG